MVYVTESGEKLFSVEQAEQLAAEINTEKADLKSAVETQLTQELTAYAQKKVYDVQQDMEELSNSVYNSGQQVYDGITGKAADAASSKLRDLSAISGFDEGALSIKMSD